MQPKDFQNALLAFYDQQGRKNLPWQKNTTPYRVWVSEIMLQQTQVATVIPYYERFMHQFPTLEHLAKANEDDVLCLWSGLGYYSRARNLLKCAQQIVDDFQGIWPDTLEQLQSLPGIGRSTAGAILSLSMQKAASILDGNVKRVLCRFYAIEGWPGQTAVNKQLWDIAEKLTPQSQTAQYNQAMMDLGASLCRRRHPECHQCPLHLSCEAKRNDRQHDFPNSKPKKAKPLKNKRFALLISKQQILLEKRPSSGIWGGLWALPEIPDNIHQIKPWAQEALCQSIGSQEAQPQIKHTFTHFHLNIHPIKLCLKDSAKQPPIKFNWHKLSDLDKIGLPAPFYKWLSTLQ